MKQFLKFNCSNNILIFLALKLCSYFFQGWILSVKLSVKVWYRVCVNVDYKSFKIQHFYVYWYRCHLFVPFTHDLTKSISAFVQNITDLAY